MKDRTREQDMLFKIVTTTQKNLENFEILAHREKIWLVGPFYEHLTIDYLLQSRLSLTFKYLLLSFSSL